MATTNLQTDLFDVETSTYQTLFFSDNELAADFTEYIAKAYDIHMHCKVNFANLLKDVPIPAFDKEKILTGSDWKQGDITDGVDALDIDANYEPFARKLRNVLVNGDLVHTKGFYQINEDEDKIFARHKGLLEEVEAKQRAKDLAEQKVVDQTAARAVAAAEKADADKELLAATANNTANPSGESTQRLTDATARVAAALSVLEGFDGTVDADGNPISTGSLADAEAARNTADGELTAAQTAASTASNELRDGEGNLSSQDIMNQLLDDYMARSHKPDNLEYVSEDATTGQQKNTVEPSANPGIWWKLSQTVEEVLRSAIQVTNFSNYQAAQTVDGEVYDPESNKPRLLPSTDISRKYLVEASASLRTQFDIKMESDRTDAFMRRPKQSDQADNSSVWNGAFFTPQQAGELVAKLWEFETEQRRDYREAIQAADPASGQIEAILQNHTNSSDGAIVYAAYVPRLEYVAMHPGGNIKPAGIYSKYNSSLVTSADKYDSADDVGAFTPVSPDNLIAESTVDQVIRGKFNPAGFREGDKLSSVLHLKVFHAERDNQFNAVANVDTYKIKVTFEHDVSIPKDELWEWSDVQNKLMKKTVDEPCYPSVAEERTADGCTTVAGSYVFKKCTDSAAIFTETGAFS